MIRPIAPRRPPRSRRHRTTARLGRAALAALVALAAAPGSSALTASAAAQETERPAQRAFELPEGALRSAADEAERRLVSWVEAHAEEATAFLERVVNVNSGTMNHAGVREVGRIFAEELASLGFETRWVEMPDSVNRAGHLFAERRGDRGLRLLLIGHLDTVFEEDSPFQRFERLDEHTARGPGVEDMKGGDVVILYALKALHAAGALEGTDIAVALIGDEESAGLPIAVSRGALIEAGRRAHAALGFEGATGAGERAVVARRGSSGWTLRVSGRPAHSSGIFSERAGSGAAFELARILHGFHEEVRGEEYLTFNPGIVLGGTEVTYDAAENRGTAFGKTNVIAADAVADGGLRFLTEEQKERARERMRQMVGRHLPHTSARIEFTDKYPAMPPTDGNRRLLEALDATSRALGHGPVGPVDPGSRGAADISFVAPHVAGLDGLGVVGSGGHTVEETVDLRSLPVATGRAAVLIYRLTGGGG